MKRTVIFSLILAVFITIISLLTASEASTSTACPKNCASTVILNTNFANCTGVRCGPGGTHEFTTDINGDFTLSCRCAGTYTFCLGGCGGGVWSVTVDGSSGTFYAVQGGLCPCGDE